jgi:hypothetical protein
MTLPLKSRLVKDYGMLVTGGITFDPSRSVFSLRTIRYFLS